MIPIVIDCELETLNNVIECEFETEIHVDGNVTVTRLEVTENGTYQEDGVAYSPVVVDVEGLVPTGTLDIAENGLYDVTEKANADVNVKQWDDELIEILDGDAISLSGLPSGLTKIKPYAFYCALRNLPRGYTEVEYLQAVGDTYIDTQIVSNGTDRVEQKIQRTANQDSVQSWFGSMESTNLTRFSFGQYNSSGRKVLFGGFNVTQQLGLSDTNVHILEMGSDGGYYCSVDEQRIYYSPSAYAQPTITSYIFARHGASGVSNAYDGGLTKIFYHYQWMADGTPKLMLTPCKRDSDGRLGFYDSVRNLFLTNEQGNLISGAEVPRTEVTFIKTADLDVTEIGEYAFYNNELSSLTLRANQVVTLGKNALVGTDIANGSGTVYVPSELVDSYEADSNWSAYNIQAI